VFCAALIYLQFGFVIHLQKESNAQAAHKMLAKLTTVYFVNEGFMLYNSLSLSKSIEWKRDSNLTYPNMTVCFAKFFDKQQLEGKKWNQWYQNFVDS